jgi:antitoxin FitA
MATLTIRNLSEATRRALKERAARHNHSMEAEVRLILDDAVGRDTDVISAWLDATEGLRGEFRAPPRSVAREVDLS